MSSISPNIKTVNLSLLLFLFLLLPPLSFSQTLKGKVVSVADGDTITILNNHNQQTKIRLYGIDTPEKSQAFGQKAKQFTASLTARRNVIVEVYDTDKYGRSVGVVFVDGTNVNDEIVRAGYAWHYRSIVRKTSVMIG